MRIEIQRTAKYVPAFEIAERKGLGHPDTICDFIAEEASRALCREYLDRFGRILHHNVDKVLLVAGRAKPRFGGGGIEEPFRIYVAGRATEIIGEEVVDVEELITSAARKVFERYHALNPTLPAVIPKVGRGSVDLIDLYERGQKVPLSNDTSVGVGFWPYTRLERAVLELEKFLNSESFKKEFPETGEDVKVMGIRVGEDARFTVAMAFIDSYFSSLEEYIRSKEEVLEEIRQFLSEYFDAFSVALNAADNYDAGAVYITVTGLSAENGDDGANGRGNRIGGLITPMRPMSMEGISGKNPVSHVGKTYNIIAREIARELVYLGAEEATVFLVSKIGAPVTDPQLIGVQVAEELPEEDVKGVVEDKLDLLPKVWEKVLEGEYELF